MKQIAGVLVATMLIGSVPAWAEGQSATSQPAAAASAQRLKIRDSIDRAIDRAPAGAATATATGLTAQERQDLESRHAALKTDPVARGAGGIIMLLLGTALSVGATAYIIKQTKKETTPPALAR